MDRTSNSIQSGEYLPRVLRRIDYLHLDISDKPCDVCGYFAEDHTWVVINHNGSKVIYCSEAPVIQPIGHSTKTVGKSGIIYV